LLCLRFISSTFWMKIIIYLENKYSRNQCQLDFST
jgi:hypothetical protein